LLMWVLLRVVVAASTVGAEVLILILSWVCRR
jgi:hypothetical protein